MDSASATAPREALIKHHHMNYYKTVQFTSQKTSQRPDDKLEWQQGEMVNITDSDLGRGHYLSITICDSCGFSSQKLVGEQELT
jgi:hypothetical protein